MANAVYTSLNHKAMIQRRRDIVADYISRGIESFTLISEAWEQAGIIHPVSEQPYTQQTYQNDRAYLKQQWAKENNQKIDAIMADITMKQNRVYKEAMEHHDYGSALAALKGLREVLDVDKPKGSRAIKIAADERHKRGESESELTEAEAGEMAVELDSSPAVLGEMLQIMRDNGVIHAALMEDTEQAKAAKEMHAGLSDGNEPFLASANATEAMNGITTNGVSGNANGLNVSTVNQNNRR